jgi:hypothetical protein
MPTNGCAFELLRFLLGEQVEVAECVLERDDAELAQGRLGGPEVALLERGRSVRGLSLERSRRDVRGPDGDLRVQARR